MRKTILLCVMAALLLSVLSVPAVAEGEITVTVNGETVRLSHGATLADAVGEGLIYALCDGEILTDPATLLSDGMELTVRTLSLHMREQAELRLVWPSGIRFLTIADRDEMETLLLDERVTEVEAGTLILPADLLPAGAELTHESLADVPHLDVSATPEAPYAETGDLCVLAGSVSDVQDKNYGRAFVGRGYVRVTLSDGTRVTRYASLGELPTGCFGILASDAAFDADTRLEREGLAYFQEVAASLHRKPLMGLDVLSIGDSLFDGDFLSGDQQWIGLLAAECDWNLTNLGRDGWTVAYNPAAYADPAKVRSSMYQNLMENRNYCYGGKGSFSFGSPSRDPEQVDLILLEGGVNDYNWGIPLGGVNDTDGSTVLGAWRLMIEKLLTDYPNARIVFVTSWYVEGSKTVNGEERQRMDYVCYGIRELIEAHFKDEERLILIEAGDPAVSGVDMADSAYRSVYGKSANDTNHLNALGMKVMQRAMRRLLWEALTDERDG